ncbi:hypothetical protein BH10BAC2_BH10BAC2_43230 [soil metagenome]
MRSIKLPYVFLIIFFGCTQHTQNVIETFVVPADTMPVYQAIPNQPPPPPPVRTYYFVSNFLIDTAEQIFFYQREQNGWFCGTGIKWNTPPAFIDLQPMNIIQIPTDNIEAFIKLNILNIDSANRYVSIGSTQDTVKSIGLTKIIKLFKEKTNHIRWRFRKVTQEEAIVLDYKKRQASYYADAIKWDSTKTLFPPSIDDMIKFTPPKI